MYACLCVCSYKCAYIYVNIHEYVFEIRQVFVYVRAFVVCVCVCMSRCVYSCAYIYDCMCVYVRGAYDKFPDVFRMGTFIDSTHMKL